MRDQVSPRNWKRKKNLRPEGLSYRESHRRRDGASVPPAEYTQGAERVPAAGRAESLKLKIGFPLVGVLQRPTAVFEPAAVNDFDGLGEARIARSVDSLEIIERAENVVVPPGRKGEAREFRLDDFAGAMRSEKAVKQQELAGTALRGAQLADMALAMQFVEEQAL
jgi:hypothetical protein